MMTKLFSRTLQSRSGLIFFAILAIYNLLLGIYLKDFLVLSPMLLAFYLLSALPPLLFVIRIRSAPMRAIVYIVLFFVLLMSTLSFVLCRRLLPIITMIITAAEMMYLAIYDDSSGKDKPLTEIYVLAGIVFKIPHQPIVIILDFSISPQLTITGGTGAISAPPRHFNFAIVSSPFAIFTLLFYHNGRALSTNNRLHVKKKC